MDHGRRSAEISDAACQISERRGILEFKVAGEQGARPRILSPLNLSEHVCTANLKIASALRRSASARKRRRIQRRVVIGLIYDVVRDLLVGDLARGVHDENRAAR